MATQLTRSGVASLLDAAVTLNGWTVYDEPPEQLVGGRCIVVAPRSPYMDWETMGDLYRVFLSIHVLVIRSHGPAMDQVDAGLLAVRGVLMDIATCDIEGVSGVNLVDDIGGPQYIAATVDCSVEAA